MAKTLKIYMVFLSALLLSAVAGAQSGGLNSQDRFESARRLYFSGSYYAAEKAFKELGEDTDALKILDRAEIEAFKVLCAIAIDKVNADGQVKTFCDKYPNAPQQAMVKHALATHYFDRGEYAAALKLFDSINPKHIHSSTVTDFTFRKAYCDLRVGNVNEAIDGFRSVTDREYGIFTIPATYYLAYSYYIEKDFEEAVPLFEKCVTDQRYSLMARYYAVESMFMLDSFEYVTEKGQELLPELEGDLRSKMAKILSETYYEKGDNERASGYLDLYREGGSEFTRKDYYFSGILSYGLHSYRKAIEEFSHTLGENDELSQNAYYYTANSYLETRNKVAAMAAFKSASEGDFDPVIKEDAMFNYAKLSFDVNQDISQFAHYMEVFPRSGKEDVINGYMAASFLLSKDYRSAVEALSKISRPTVENIVNLQKAAFFRAMQLIENNGYRAAVPLLEQSIENGRYNASLTRLAKYWLAECCYRSEDFERAITINAGLLDSDEFADTDEYPNAIYNQAYSFFKKGDFASAVNWFDSYIGLPARRKAFDRDAKVRKADALFMQNDYQAAASLYESVYNVSDEVYPAFQASLAYGLLGNDSKKIALLKQVARDNRSSQLYPKALFELGRTYVQGGKDDEASECFYTLLGMKTDSDYYTKSLLELAMINTNAGKYERAAEYYKTIVSEVPYSEEAVSALSGLESLYQSQNKPDEFLAYIEEIGMSDLKTADEKEMMLFNSAEQLFFAKKDANAIAGLEKYLAAYPEGGKAPKATFYIGEIFKAQGHLEQAADKYMEVMKMDMNDCTEAATSAYAGIQLSLDHYQQALEAYDALVSITSGNSRTSAFMGRMRAQYGLKRFDEAIKDAQVVAAASGISEAMEREAQYIMARSYMTSGERDMAMSLFESLSENVDDQFGAEAAYLMILDAYDIGDFTKVEELVYNFADSGSEQLYWLAKSFIVLGDAFADRDDMEQAKATFESILEGYEPKSDNDDVIGQVNNRLKLIKNLF